MSIFENALDNDRISLLQESKLALVPFALSVASDHFDIEIRSEDSRLFGLAILSRFHQKDGRGGGHVLLSAAEAFEAIRSLLPQEKQRLEEIDQALRTATARRGVTPSTIVDVSLWRLARDSEKHINFPDIQAPGDAFLSIQPFHDPDTGKNYIINVVDPNLFRVRTVAEEYAYFIDEQLSYIRQNFGEHAPYGPRINAHDIVHSLAQEFAPNAELSVRHFNNYAPNATIPGNYYRQDKPDLSFSAFKKVMKPSFQEDSYHAVGTSAARLALLAEKGSQFLDTQNLADDEKLFYLGGDAPSAERFELGAAYLESQLLVRADPHDLAGPEGQPFNELSAAARLERLATFWKPEKSRATTIALPDGRTLPYPAQPMTTLQENAILAQIAKTLMYEAFLKKYIETSAATDSPLQNRARENLKHISKIDSPDGRNLAQLMHATLTTLKQAEQYRAGVNAGGEVLGKYFTDLQHSLSNRAAIHFNPDRPVMYAALKTFGNPRTAASLKTASERILLQDIPPIQQVQPNDLTPAQQQLLARLGDRET